MLKKVAVLVLVLSALSHADWINLKSQNGHFLVAEGAGGGPANANRAEAREWESFELIDHNGPPLNSGDIISLRTWNNTHFLCAEDTGALVANRTEIGPWEKFTIRKLSGDGEIRYGDLVSLQSCHGGFVVAEQAGGGDANANREQVGPWEQWTFLQSNFTGGVPSTAISSVKPPNSSAKSQLQVGERLHVGEVLTSKDRRFFLGLQGDGNLVLYRRTQRGNIALWAAGTAGTKAAFLGLQGDGNLVLYSEGQVALWNAGTAGKAADRLVVQDDGNLVLYSTANEALWNSGSVQMTRPNATGKPYVLFVNGFGDGCIQDQSAVRQFLNEVNAEWHIVPWNAIFVGNNYASSQADAPSNDARFLAQGEQFLSNLPNERPLILIGHSFGGDSLMKLAPRIRRPIDLLVVIDPVTGGTQAGNRVPWAYQPVPKSVRIFLNRWQNVLPWPVNLGTSGSMRIADRAYTKADQEEQNIDRHEDFSPRTRSKRWYEFGPANLQRRTDHKKIAGDSYVQALIIRYINEALP